jgi:hypothetical protein
MTEEQTTQGEESQGRGLRGALLVTAVVLGGLWFLERRKWMARQTKTEWLLEELREDGIYPNAGVIYRADGKVHRVEYVEIRHHGKSGHSSRYVKLAGIPFVILPDEVDTDPEPDGRESPDDSGAEHGAPGTGPAQDAGGHDHRTRRPLHRGDRRLRLLRRL